MSSTLKRGEGILSEESVEEFVSKHLDLILAGLAATGGEDLARRAT